MMDSLENKIAKISDNNDKNLNKIDDRNYKRIIAF